VPPPHIRHWSDLPAVFDQALREYRAGETGRAEQLCQEILQHSPRHIEALRLSATIARQGGIADDAIRLLTRAAAAQDNDPQLQWELGGALQSAGRFDDAAGCFERAIALKPEFAKAHNALGGIYMESRRYDDAIAAFARAAELQPDYMAAHNNLGLALRRQGRHAESLACFRRAAELAPESIIVARNLKEATLARSASERGDADAAIPLVRASNKTRVSGT
jgi:tetratricopeptide (TPR) repeat protein